jgi:hypothetical protein
MICIAIAAEAYEAIERTLALGTVAVEPQPNENCERLIWLEKRWLDKLNLIRRSEAIIRLAALWEGHWMHRRTLRKLGAMRRRWVAGRPDEEDDHRRARPQASSGTVKNVTAGVHIEGAVMKAA